MKYTTHSAAPRIRGVVARAAAAAAVALLIAVPRASSARGDLVIDSSAWRIVASQSGRVNYYRVVGAPASSVVHASYEPGLRTAVLGFEVPRDSVRSFHHLTWRWRAEVLPRGGDECKEGAQDSAAVVYVTWKRALRWYTLKYVWSAVGVKGNVCDRKRSLFLAQDTIIVESGDAGDAWKEESLDLDAEFRAHFGDDLPDLEGLGLMTDGDQTRSESAADYGRFVLSP